MTKLHLSDFDSIDKFMEAVREEKMGYSFRHMWDAVIVAVCIGIAFLIICVSAHAEPITLTASWYSIDSLKKEGTFKYSKGVMANGKVFNDNNFTCACRLYPLGSILRITNLSNGKSVEARVTDRIGKRFANSRVDLSRSAFLKIADLKQEIVKVSVEQI